MLSGCAREPVPAPVEDRSMASRPGPRLIDSHRVIPRPPEHYRVRSGDTLHGIAWRFGLDVHRLATWNKLNSPFVIFPDQVLRLKAPKSRGARVTHHGAKARSKPEPAVPVTAERTQSKSGSVTRKPSPPPAQPARISGAPANVTLVWRWPTNGPLLTRFSAKDAARKGVDVGGRFGQSVYAAADGQVVYAGSKLLGYGKLIIIEHSDTLLSAYGHNRALLVNEGDKVKIGQKIAEMGVGKTDKPSLHFEIRRDGEPVDPLDFVSPGK